MPENGVRFCQGGFDPGVFDRRVPSFDGTPLDADLTLPASGSAPYPLIVMLHGLGGSKVDYEGTGPLESITMASQGYAVLTYTARGFGESCGTMASRTPACQKAGWIHLADQRYEIRDTQYLAGELVDEGIARPGIAVTGVSYGGGQSLELAVLDNRIRLLDGRLVPWVSPKYHVSMYVAATYAQWGWDDLVDALIPDGGLRWTGPVDAAADRSPVGVQKEHWLNLLYGVSAANYLSAPGQDPNADLTVWQQETSRGEPYSLGQAAHIDQELQDYKSAIGIPLPPGGIGAVMLQQGTTDSLFPVGQATQFASRLTAAHDHSPLLLELADIGHSSQNKAADTDAVDSSALTFLDDVMLHHVQPPSGVVARTTTCPSSAPSGGPVDAPDASGLATAQLSFDSSQDQTIRSGPTPAATAVDVTTVVWCQDHSPLSGADTASAGVAMYPLGGSDVSGLTVMGPADVHAQLQIVGKYPELVGELWDVAPDGTRRIVQVGVVRPAANQAPTTSSTTPADTTVDFQLMPNFETLAPGHTLTLTLSASDAPYYRASNGQFTIRVDKLHVEVPYRTGV